MTKYDMTVPPCLSLERYRLDSRDTTGARIFGVVLLTHSRLISLSIPSIPERALLEGTAYLCYVLASPEWKASPGFLRRAGRFAFRRRVHGPTPKAENRAG